LFFLHLGEVSWIIMNSFWFIRCFITT
jgi:hypothetical protein